MQNGLKWDACGEASLPGRGLLPRGPTSFRLVGGLDCLSEGKPTVVFRAWAKLVSLSTRCISRDAERIEVGRLRRGVLTQ